MKRILLGIAAVIATAAIPASIFAYGQHVARNDQRLFSVDDDKRRRLIARACGTHGRLWQDPMTRQYACLYVNPDGEALMQAVPDAPLLVVQR